MKKLFLSVALMLAGVSHADSRYSYSYVLPADFFQGDAITPPISAASNDALYYSRFLSQTVGTMAAVLGVTLVANIQLPTGIKPGAPVTIGATLMYSGVTNSAVLSPTVKVQSTTYIDSKANTSLALTVLAPVALTTAQMYGGPYDVELGTVNAYGGDVVTVHLSRTAGENSLLYFYRIWARAEPTKGWFW